MHGPLPSTSELALLLPSWPTGTVDARWNPTDSEWGKKNVPWFWSEDDFAQQTRALVRANTPAREMIAWLVHGVRWDSGQRNPGGVALDNLVHRWHSHGGYLRAWTKEVGDTVPAEALEAHCRQLFWHPAWRNQDLSRVLDDFVWATSFVPTSRAARPCANRCPVWAPWSLGIAPTISMPCTRVRSECAPVWAQDHRNPKPWTSWKANVWGCSVLLLCVDFWWPRCSACLGIVAQPTQSG